MRAVILQCMPIKFKNLFKSYMGIYIPGILHQINVVHWHCDFFSAKATSY